jgi:hypothetical protein
MIYTAPCVMFLMRADTLRGQVGGGWALEIESFLGPVKWYRADRRVPFGAQKTSFYSLLCVHYLFINEALYLYCRESEFIRLFALYSPKPPLETLTNTPSPAK